MIANRSFTSQISADESKQSLKRFRRNFLFSIVGILLVILIVYIISPVAIIGIRTTESVPGYVFLIIKNRMPMRDDYVAFMPPPNKFYKNIRFIKYLGGMPGDKVTQEGRHFFINGKYIGYAKETAMSGDSLEVSGSGVIPEKKYFVRGTHPDSFDSRYKDIGLIDEKNILGTAYRIF